MNELEEYLHDVSCLCNVKSTIRKVIKFAKVSEGNENIVRDGLCNLIKKQSAVVYSFYPHDLDQSKLSKIYRGFNIQSACIKALVGICGPKYLLDSMDLVKIIDTHDLLVRLNEWGVHFSIMYERATKCAGEFKRKFEGHQVSSIKIYGLGCSASPHDLTRDILYKYLKSSIEIQVNRTNSPRIDHVDEKTLIIISSFSGNNEETVNCYNSIKPLSKLIVIIARKNSQLFKCAEKNNHLFIEIPCSQDEKAYVESPRESLCLQMTASLMFLVHIDVMSGVKGKLSVRDLFANDICSELQKWNKCFRVETRFDSNLAKQYAFRHCSVIPDIVTVLFCMLGSPLFL